MVSFGSITTQNHLISSSEIRELAQKAVARTQTDARMSKNGSIMTEDKTNTSTTTNQNLSYTQAVNAMATLNQWFKDSTDTDVSNTTSTNGTSSASSSSGTNSSSGSSPGGAVDTGDSYSGIAQGLSTDPYKEYPKILERYSFEIDSIDNHALGRVSDQDSLTRMHGELSNMQADLSNALADAQADYSNIRSQQLTAQSNVSRLEGTVDTAKQERDAAQTALQDNTSNLNSSIKARDTLDDQLSSVNDEYKSNCEAVKSAEKEKSSAQTQVSNAKTSKSQADAALTSANQTLSSAEATLASTPKTLNDGSPNPEYQVAQTAVTNAKRQVQQAQEAQKQAQQALDTAESQLKSAEESLISARETKNTTLQTFQDTDSQYKDMAKNCQQLQETVENNQSAYDSSLTTFDDASANYTRLNEELVDQQGILTQAESYQIKLESLQEQYDKIQELKTRIDDAKEKNNAGITGSQLESEMLENANASEGCSALKTPAENLISMKDGNYEKSINCIYSGADYDFADKAMQSSNFIKNADGSRTDPSNGLTYIQMSDGCWVRTDRIRETEYDAEAQSTYPEVYNTYVRARDQEDVFIGRNHGSGDTIIPSTLSKYNSNLR